MTAPAGVSANVTLVQALYQAFAQRDVGTLLTCLSSDVEWGQPDNPFNPAAGTRHGHAGFLEWLRIGNQAEEVLLLEPREFLAGAETVAVVGFTRCRAKPMGRLYETEFVLVISVKEGRVVRFREFFDTYAAAEAFRPG